MVLDSESGGKGGLVVGIIFGVLFGCIAIVCFSIKAGLIRCGNSVETAPKEVNITQNISNTNMTSVTNTTNVSNNMMVGGYP